MILHEEAVLKAFDHLAKQSQNNKYRYDPVAWAQDVLKVTLWSKQKEILRSLVSNKKTAVKSCHAASKTHTSAIAVCWWISTRTEPKVRSTAPTSYQVHELLWSEIRRMHAEGKLAGEVNQKDEWKKNIFGAVDTVGSGKKPSDGNIHAFHGVHAKDGVLTVIDEACGVDHSLFTAADAISTGRYDRVLAVGNPDDPDTAFGDIFLKETEENKHIWHKMTISAFDTPNFTGEEVPEVVRNSTIQAEWVKDRGLEWGVDSGRYKSKILGEFPDQSDNTLFPQKTIYVAHETEIPEDFDFPLVLGVDIGGGGEDDTVIYGNRNGRVRKVSNWNEGNALYTAKRILDVAEEVKAEEIRIDSGGFGKGVVDVILKDPRVTKFNIIRMMGGDASSDINSYRNKRAENYDYLRMQMELGKIDLDPKDTKVNEQLLGVKYETTERGSIKLEAKADIRKRNGKSPDDVDAIVYATADLSYLFDQDDHDEYETMSPLDYMNEMPGWASVRW